MDKKTKKIIKLIDEIFTENEEICESGISSFDCINRLVEINEKLANIQVMLSKINKKENDND
jgi:hypothetical protein